MSIPPQIPIPEPKDIEVLDFDVLEEKWNDYELADETKLRGRFILTKLMRAKHGPADAIGIAAQTIFTVTALPDRRGSRSQPPLQEEWDSLTKDPVGILNSTEPWNQYRIPKLNNKLIQAKLVVTAVFQFPGKFDQEGEPFYIVTSSPLIAPGTP